MTTLRAALYLRQSITATEGIDRQRARCLKLAADKGWTVVDSYVDNDVSATKARGAGTAWGRMLSETANFDVLVAVDLDRLLRSTTDLVKLIELKIKVTTVDGEIDLSTADGAFRGSMLAAIAAFETTRKTERAKRANEHRASLGKPTSGRRPFGYEPDRITLRKAESDLIKWMHDEVLNKGTTLYAIQQKLNKDGVRTAGGEWSEKLGRKTAGGNPFSPIQLKKLLLRPRNAGLLEMNGVIQANSTIVPIVTVEDHQAMVAILTDPSRGPARGPKAVINWLSTLMVCATCGAPMTTKTTGAGRRYACSAKLARTDGGGRHVTINAETAEARTDLAMYGEILGGWSAAPKSNDDGALKKVQIDIAENARLRGDLTELWTVPGADKKWITGELVKLATEGDRLDKLRTQLLARGAQGNELAELVAESRISRDEPVEKFMEIWQAYPPERRRSVVRGTFHIIVFPGQGASRMRFIPV